MKLTESINTFFVIFASLIDFEECRLSEQFKYYEIANQNHFRHVISKRSTDNEFQTTRQIDLKFKNRNYKLELLQENALFTPDFKIYGVDEKDLATEIKNVDFKLFHGHVAGERDSKVSAIFGNNGELGGFVVRMPQETFAGEPLVSYDGDSRNMNDLIIYSHEDVKLSQQFNESLVHNGTRIDDDGGGDDDSIPKRASRVDRSTTSAKYCQSENHKACTLYLAVDYSFFSQVGGCSYSLTANIAVSVIDQVNEIFKKTTFGECGRNFGFQINKMIIYLNYSVGPGHFNDKSNSLDSKQFLCMFGRKSVSPDLSEHCLGHLLTAKSMQNDVLGLSNIGATKSQSGICSKQESNYKNYNYLCYMNTGFTTFKDSYHKRLPTLQAMLVVAHELGHSFGSHHDPSNDTMCAPSKHPGYFLMYALSVPGTESNNKMFSNCSIMEIKEVLKNRAASCFIAYNTSFCGNFKVEDNEECDDGFQGSTCCTSQCGLQNGSKCSDVNHECCKNCNYAERIITCRESYPCLESSLCSGHSAVCPKSVVKPDETHCQTRAKVHGICSNGECIDLCQRHDKVICPCHDENMCHVCCKDKYSENSTCELLKPQILLPDGMACAYGICKQGQCEETEVSQIQRLWPIIDIKDISALVIFTKNNIVGLLLVVTLMVWIPASCAVARLDRKNMKKELETLQWMASSQKNFLPKKNNIKLKISSH